MPVVFSETTGLPSTGHNMTFHTNSQDALINTLMPSVAKRLDHPTRQALIAAIVPPKLTTTHFSTLKNAFLWGCEDVVNATKPLFLDAVDLDHKTVLKTLAQDIQNHHWDHILKTDDGSVNTDIINAHKIFTNWALSFETLLSQDVLTELLKLNLETDNESGVFQVSKAWKNNTPTTSSEDWWALYSLVGKHGGPKCWRATTDLLIWNAENTTECDDKPFDDIIDLFPFFVSGFEDHILRGILKKNTHITPKATGHRLTRLPQTPKPQRKELMNAVLNARFVRTHKNRPQDNLLETQHLSVEAQETWNNIWSFVKNTT